MLNRSDPKYTQVPLDALVTRWPAGTPPELIDVANEWAAEVLATHGIGAFRMPYETALLHESSHCIVAAAEGRQIKSVEVLRATHPLFGKIWGGRFFEAKVEVNYSKTSSLENDLARTRIIAAGYAGEFICGLSLPGSSLDERTMARHYAGHIAHYHPACGFNDGRDVLYELVHKQIERILCANERPLNLLGELLDEKKRAQGAMLQEVLSQVQAVQSLGVLA